MKQPHEDVFDKHERIQVDRAQRVFLKYSSIFALMWVPFGLFGFVHGPNTFDPTINKGVHVSAEKHESQTQYDRALDSFDPAKNPWDVRVKKFLHKQWI